MNRFSRDFETKFGMAIDDKLEQKVKITLLATGFGIQDIHMKEMDDRITLRTAEEQQRLAELEEEEEQRRNRREVYYGKDANARSQTQPPSSYLSLQSRRHGQRRHHQHGGEFSDLSA